MVQETLLPAWRNPQILDPECASQRSSLYAVARNIVIDEWRTTRWSPETEIDRIPDQPIGDARDSGPGQSGKVAGVVDAMDGGKSAAVPLDLVNAGGTEI